MVICGWCTKMATEFHIFAAGAWRKAKALHYNHGGTWRTLKEAWRNVGGTWVKVFSAAGFVPAFGYLSVIAVSATGAPQTGSITVDPDSQLVGAGSFGSPTLLYYSPQTAGVGAGHEVKLTHVSGTHVPSNAGVWLALSSARTFSLSVAANAGYKLSSGTIEIRRIADSVVVSSGTYDLEVGSES